MRAVAAARRLFRRDAEIGAVEVAAAAERISAEDELVAVAHRQRRADAQAEILATVFLPGEGDVYVAADRQPRGDFLADADVGKRAAFHSAHAFEFFRAGAVNAVFLGAAEVVIECGRGGEAVTVLVLRAQSAFGIGEEGAVGEGEIRGNGDVRFVRAEVTRRDTDFCADRAMPSCIAVVLCLCADCQCEEQQREGFHGFHIVLPY